MEEKKEKKEDRSNWAVGGGLMLGLGIGFFFVTRNPMALVGCMLAGLGVGLIISSILHTVTNKQK
ncbi:MAG TPA: hypothetical protein DCO79_01390 [Spirochaeta sp.]|nr:hypothetical protein [Spirochaeta sp.]